MQRNISALHGLRASIPELNKWSTTYGRNTFVLFSVHSDPFTYNKLTKLRSITMLGNWLCSLQGKYCEIEIFGLDIGSDLSDRTQHSFLIVLLAHWMLSFLIRTARRMILPQWHWERMWKIHGIQVGKVQANMKAIPQKTGRPTTWKIDEALKTKIKKVYRKTKRILL